MLKLFGFSAHAELVEACNRFGQQPVDSRLSPMKKDLFPTYCDKVIESGLIFLIIFTAFAFGAVHIWAYTLMELTVFFLLLVWFLKLVITSKKEKESSNWLLTTDHWSLAKTPLNLPLILFLSLILFQMIPFPPQMLKILSPATYNLYQQTLPGYESRVMSHEVQGSGFRVQGSRFKVQVPTPDSRLSTQPWKPLSIYQHATRTEFRKFFTYTGVFFLVINTLKARRQIRRLVLALIITGAVVALLGIVQMLSGTDRIYWFWRSHFKIGGYFGPYVNPNHFAGYMEMVVPLALGLLLTRPLPAIGHQSTSWRYRLSTLDSWLSNNVLLIFAVVMMSASLFLSLSRGSIISFFLSLVLFFVFLGFKKSQQWNKKVITITLGLVFAFLIWIGIDPVLRELSTLFNLQNASPERPEVWKDTITMAKDFPLFGVGLGNFQHLYPTYKTIPSQSWWDHTHNDYLEMFADTGILGMLLFFGGIMLFLLTVITKWQKRRHPLVVGITLGGASGVIAFLFHSLVEFNLHIPANALLFFMMLGIIASTVHLKIRGETEYSLLPVRTYPLNFKMKLVGGILAILLLVSLSAPAVRACLGDKHFHSYQSQINQTNETNQTNQINLLTTAIALDPSNARYHYELGRYYAHKMREGWEEGNWKLEKGKWFFDHSKKTLDYGLNTLDSFYQAVNLQPTNAWFHVNLGWVFHLLSQLPINSTNSTNPTNLTNPAQLTNFLTSAHEFNLALMLDPNNQYLRTYVSQWRGSFPDDLSYQRRALQTNETNPTNQTNP